MGKEILQKYTIFEVKRQLAEMEKQYSKERIAKMLGEDRAAEIDREFKKVVAERLEPYWKDIQAYEHGGFWARLRVQIKYTFRDRSTEYDVPKYVLQSIVGDMLPDIRAFFESEEGKREFEEWKKQREKKLAEEKKNIKRNDFCRRRYSAAKKYKKTPNQIQNPRLIGESFQKEVPVWKTKSPTI